MMSSKTLRIILLLLFSWLTQPVYANVCALPSDSGIGGTGAPIYNIDNGIGGTGQTAINGNGSGIGGTGQTAINSNGSGIGGTGQTAINSNGSGIGGTGQTAINSNGSGIGGTGQTAINSSDSGIGGTGLPVQQEADAHQLKTGRVSGTITGFGSICVNGIEIHYASSTPLSVDGEKADLSSLAIGQVVTVSVKGVGNEVYADQIHIMHAASGPIDYIDPINGQLSVLGQQITVSNRQQLQKLSVGDTVNVSGLQHPNGNITASRVEPVSNLNKVSLQGTIHVAANNQVQIGAMRLTGKLPATVQPGQTVMVRGTVNSNALEVQQVIDVKQTTPASEPGGMVSVEAIINNHSDLEKLSGVPFKLTEQMRSELDSIDATRKVIITGQLDDHDVIEVRHIRIDHVVENFQPTTDPVTPKREHDGNQKHQRSEKQEADGGKFEINDHEKTKGHDVVDYQHEKPESHDVHDREIEKPEIEHHEYERPETPEVEKPELPEVEVPEHKAPEIPEVEVPEHEAPELPEVEAPEVPEIEKHEYEAPEIPEHEDHSH